MGKDFHYGGTKGHIVGVIKDFHFESMHQAIVPMVLIMLPPSNTYFNNVSIKIAGNNHNGCDGCHGNNMEKIFPANAI
ncbi:MAG: hypothetical protein WDO19_28040 [Bacteroidota bacterium]